jgi:hypothetical protein
VLVGEDGQAMATACAAALEDIAPVLFQHPEAEAMDAQAAAVLGLEGSLHDKNLSQQNGAGSPAPGSDNRRL